MIEDKRKRPTNKPPAQQKAGDKQTRPPRKPGEKKPPKRISADYLHNSGLYYLQRYAASSAHFRTVMMRKINRSCRHHTDQDIEKCAAMLDELIAKFTEMGLLNDDGYTRGMVNSLRRRGLSSRAIHAKLSAKGLTAEQIGAALAEHNDTIDTDAEITAGLRLARRKKLGPFIGIKDTPRDKQLATLARAGYGYDVASRILDMDEDSAEEYLRQLL